MSLPEYTRPRAVSAVLTGRFAGEAVDLFDQVAAMVLVVCVLAVTMTFRDYGIIWDEEWQNVYGQKLLSFYASGFADHSAFNYFNLYLYGGLFDLTAAIVNLVSPLGVYETRHLLCGLVGVLAMAGAWAVGRRIGGPRAGLLSLSLLALTPVFYGHIFFNPKDVPFACGMIWSLYWLVRIAESLPRPSFGAVAAFGVICGMTLATRIGGLILFFYAGLAVLAYGAARINARNDWRAGAKVTIESGLRLLPALPIAYAVMAVGWPWAVLNWSNPLTALWTFSHFGWEGLVEINGQWISALHLPWTYLPLFLGIQLPEIFLAGLAAALGLAIWEIRRVHVLIRRPSLGFGVVILAALFPIAYFIAFRPNAYHTVRHFLFVIPPLAIVAGFGIDRVWQIAERRSLMVAAAIAGLFCAGSALQVERMIELHPNEYISYNSLVGGVAGAKGRFELDYWGNSLAEAARLLVAKVHREGPAAMRSKTPYYVKIGGYPLSGGYFLPPSFRLTEDAEKADFVLSMTESGCDKTFSGEVIAKVVRDGATLAVVKDRRDITRAMSMSMAGQ